MEHKEHDEPRRTQLRVLCAFFVFFVLLIHRRWLLFELSRTRLLADQQCNKSLKSTFVDKSVNKTDNLYVKKSLCLLHHELG